MSKISFKCLPVGNLPYEDEKLTTKMMVKLFEKSPFLAMLPKASASENLITRTLEGLPGIKLKGRQIILDNRGVDFKQKLVDLDIVFNSPTDANLEQYKINSFFLEKYLQIIKRIKPAETIVNLIGPFTFSQLIENEDGLQVLTDRCYRKLVIQSIAVKAIWIVNKIKEHSPETKPIILLEDSKLSGFGNVKRENEDVTREVVINMYSKIIQKIKENGGLVGVQCFEKCDWQIPIEAGVDIISFDAYNNPNNLNIIAEKINNFLVGGGRINWGIVPVMNETMVKSLTIDYLYKRFVSTVEGLVLAGASERLVYNRALVSVQGNLDGLPLIFAEKAMMLAIQLSKKIPFKS